MTTILLVGRAHPRFKECLTAHFDLLELPSAKPADITPEMAARVEGVTTFNDMTPALFDALPNLKIVANFGVGYDGVDANYAAKKGVIVTNTPDVLDEEVADTTIGLLLNTSACCRRPKTGCVPAAGSRTDRSGCRRCRCAAAMSACTAWAASASRSPIA